MVGGFGGRGQSKERTDDVYPASCRIRVKLPSSFLRKEKRALKRRR